MSGSSEKKLNLIILGASGGVARAMLQLLPEYRKRFASLVLLDKSDSVLHDRYIDHKALNYEFIHLEFNNASIQDIIKKFSEKHKTALVFDMTDYPTLPILSAADSVGFHYMNCSLNLPEGKSLLHFVEDMEDLAIRFRNGMHVLSTGMNPGVVNHLIKRGVAEHGIPDEVIEMEYDSAKPRIDSGKPFITWSKVQFLNEAIRWDSGHCNSHGIYVETKKNALNTLVDTKQYLEPIKDLEQYPVGMTVAHDEIIAMCNILKVPGKFVYAIHPDSFNRLHKMVGLNRIVHEENVVFEDNIVTPLDGSDFISVWLMYDSKDICYHVEVEHQNVKGTNATLFMVAIGAIAALIDSLDNPLEKGVYSVLDLNTDNLLKIVSNYMDIKKKEVIKSQEQRS
jgi:homospermidine synthase